MSKKVISNVFFSNFKGFWQIFFPFVLNLNCSCCVCVCARLKMSCPRWIIDRAELYQEARRDDDLALPPPTTWWRCGKTRRDCGARAPRRSCRPHPDWPVGPSRQTGWTTPRGLWTSLQSERWNPSNVLQWCLSLEILTDSFEAAGGRSGFVQFCSFWSSATFGCCLGRVLISSSWPICPLAWLRRDGPGPIWNRGACFRDSSSGVTLKRVSGCVCTSCVIGRANQVSDWTSVHPDGF